MRNYHKVFNYLNEYYFLKKQLNLNFQYVIDYFDVFYWFHET